MSLEIASNWPLGKVDVMTDTELLGQVGQHLDVDHDSAETVRQNLSAMPVFARIMRNDSGGILKPGAVLRNDTGSTYGPYKAVDGIAAIASDQVAVGAVDPWLTADVADGSHFWCIYWGPCKFLFTTGTTLARNDLLITGASGRVTKYDVTTASAANNLHGVGRSLEAVDTAISSDTLFRGFAMFWK